MKNIAAIYCLFLINIFPFAQTTRLIGNLSFAAPKYHAVIKDTSEIIVSYESKVVPDVKNPTKIGTAQTVLQVGKSFSKFTDINRLKLDSLDQIFSKKDRVRTDDINTSLRFNPKYCKTILVDNSKNEISVAASFKMPYQYNEILPKFNWDLLNGNETISGYKCNLAEMDFRGRKWKAWYATELPFSSGTHCFGSLPGLILKIEDSKKEYQFLATGLEKSKKEIIWRTDENIKTLSRAAFKKLEKNFYYNPGFFITANAYNPDGTEFKPNFPAKPFNPLELE